MFTRTAALATLLLTAACSPTLTAVDAKVEPADAGADAPRCDSAVDAAAPSPPVAVPLDLAALAARLVVEVVGDPGATDAHAEPPATLLRTATRGRRSQGEAPRIVRSLDGLDLWVVTGRGAERTTRHLHLTAAVPMGVRVVPVYELPYEDQGFALVDDTARTALLLPTWPDATPFPLEAAPDAAHDGASALDATLELRWMKSCPSSRAECLLFGAPAAVAAAVDPVEPLGGWSITTTLRAVPTPRALPADARWLGGGLRAAVVQDGDDEGSEALCGVWAKLGAVPVEVLEVPCYGVDDFTGGSFVKAGLRVVWAWEIDGARVHVALLDARTGAHRAPPRTAEATSYYDVDCGNVYASMRPLPVLDGDHVGFALAWDAGRALYFGESAERGRFLCAQLPADPFATDAGVSELPAVLRMARCDGHRCLQSAE